MEEKSRFAEMMDKVSEWLNEQIWFQQLKVKWEELDPQSRIYLQFAAAGGAVLITVFALFSFYWNVHTTRQELINKSELLSMVSSATDELRTLQASNSSLAGGGGSSEPWPVYFET